MSREHDRRESRGHRRRREAAEARQRAISRRAFLKWFGIAAGAAAASGGVGAWLLNQTQVGQQPTSLDSIPGTTDLIDGNTPPPKIDKVSEGGSIYDTFPELKTLNEQQHGTLEIGETLLEVMNLSGADINLNSVYQVYTYVHGVATQFEQNGWFYPNVNYTYANQPRQLDIYVRPSIAEKRGLVLLPAGMEIPGLEMPEYEGASIYEPFEITFLRIPKPADPEITKVIPSYNDAVANIHMVTAEACQASAYVSSPQDTIPRSFVAHEIFCNSLAWHIALAQAGLSINQAKVFLAQIQSDAVGIIFNPIPPDPALYSQIPRFENFFTSSE